MAKALTPADYKTLGEYMAKNGGNVYTVARFKFNCELTDADFVQIAKHSGVHLCDLCGDWKDKSEMSTSDGICEECMDK